MQLRSRQLQHTLYVQHDDIPCATGPLQSTCYSRGDLGGGHGLDDYLFGLYWAQVAAQQSDDKQIATAGKLLAGFIESAVCSGMQPVANSRLQAASACSASMPCIIDRHEERQAPIERAETW